MEQIHLHQCFSTQEEIKSSFQGSPLLISTDQQTRGRGRGQHSWVDFPHNLAFSFSLQGQEKETLTSLEVSLLIAHFFNKTYQREIQLKWPNDLYFEGKKIGGVLLEKTQATSLFIGVGINLFPDQKLNPVTDFSFGFLFSDAQMLGLDYKKTLPAEIYHYILHHRLGPQQTKQGWLTHCFHLDQKVMISDKNHHNEGIFTGIGEWGEAKLRAKSGNIQSFFSGSLFAEEKGENSL